jgi:hypothetical protein
MARRRTRTTIRRPTPLLARSARHRTMPLRQSPMPNRPQAVPRMHPSDALPRLPSLWLCRSPLVLYSLATRSTLNRLVQHFVGADLGAEKQSPTGEAEAVEGFWLINSICAVRIDRWIQYDAGNMSGQTNAGASHAFHAPCDRVPNVPQRPTVERQHCPEASKFPFRSFRGGVSLRFCLGYL